MMDEVLFLKENIIQSKQNDKSGKNALKLIKVDKQNEFLFEKNINHFTELIDFLKSKNDVFVITGYSMCGKTLLTSVIPQIIKEQTVFYSFKCTPASTLDDLLLGFFEIFKEYAQKKLLHLPKIETQNFQERINIYLTKCENPIIIALDGLNEIKNNTSKEEIMRFVSQISSVNKIKLIITTRAFDIADLKNINLKLDTTIIKPLTLEHLKEYCLKNIINSEGIEDFYKMSRGHYFNLFFAMNYIQPTNLTIKEFVTEVNTLNKSIDQIVISKNLSLIPQSYNNLLWVIASSEFGMPVSNLLTITDNEEEPFTFLQKKGVIEITKGYVYLKDYFKNEIIKDIEPLAKINIIKGIIKFLEEQLPLKPNLRELKLSRNTIRNEISGLNNIINKTQQQKKTEKNKTAYMNILGYSRQFKTNWDGFDEIIMPKKENPEPQKNTDEKNKENKENEVIKTKEDNIFEPPKEDNSALNFAKILKAKYSYSDALMQYTDALNTAMGNNDNLQTLFILKDMADCYFKLGDYQNSIENYGKAHEVAKNENLINECYSILLQIAEIYKVTYKKDLAMEIYRDIIKQDGLDESLILNAELNLFEMNFAYMKPNEIINKYLILLDKAKKDAPLCAKIHFRLGFLYDKAYSFENAIRHYTQSIEKCDSYELNENLSSCYYNLAEIYSDRKDYEKALSYYLKSLSTDEITKKIEGQLITSRKIANIYEREKNKSAVIYYEKSIELAKLLNDNYHIACSIIDLGDYYYRKKDDMKALKIYLSAKKVLENQLTHENEIAIKDRINDLKIRLGKDVVNKIIREFS